MLSQMPIDAIAKRSYKCNKCITQGDGMESHLLTSNLRLVPRALALDLSAILLRVMPGASMILGPPRLYTPVYVDLSS